MSYLTLITDFGLVDFACGLLHGVIASIAPEVEVVDLCHEIPRHDILSAALLLDRSIDYFPSGTVHVVVVDPGVGTQRRAIAAQLGSQYFVGPDNGVLTYAYKRYSSKENPVRVVNLSQRQYWLPEVSSIFHGRDILAPVGAHLAGGIPLSDMGAEIDDPVFLDVPYPVISEGCIEGQIIHIDRFGNLSSNIQMSHIPPHTRKTQLRILIGGHEIRGISGTFADGVSGNLLALIDSTSHLAICVANGNAAHLLHGVVGSPIYVYY